MKKASNTKTRRTGHTHHHPVNEKNLLIATLMNLVITLFEIAGGILSNSLALLSDALHNLSDTFATFIAYLATMIGRKDASTKRTYGYKRIEILAALLNAVILIITCIYLVREAYLRWNHPEPINSTIMMVVAMIGLLANVYAMLILRKDANRSMNIRAAYIHLIGDSLSSIVVLIGGILLQFFDIYWIDPLITVLISLYILKEAFVILKEAVNILMQSTPSSLDISAVKHTVEQINGVKNIHHVHAWNLTDQEIHLEAHIEMVEDLKLSEVKKIQEQITALLKMNFQIQHITLQFEYEVKHARQMIHLND